MFNKQVKCVINEHYKNQDHVIHYDNITVNKWRVGSGKTSSMFELIDKCTSFGNIALISKDKFEFPKTVFANVTNFEDDIIVALSKIELIIQSCNVNICLLAIDDMYETDTSIFTSLEKFSNKHGCHIIVNTNTSNTFDHNNKLSADKLLKEISLKCFERVVPEYSVNLICRSPETGVTKLTNTLNNYIIACNRVGGKVILCTDHITQTVTTNLLQHIRTVDIYKLQQVVDSGFNISLLAIDGIINFTECDVNKLKQFAHTNKCVVIATTEQNYPSNFDSIKII